MNLTSFAVLVGHPVAGLDLAAGLDVLEELLRARLHRVASLPNGRYIDSIATDATLNRQAARLFAERGYHSTSMGHLAGGDGRAEGVALRPHAVEAGPAPATMREGAAAFHAGLDAIPEDAPAERLRLALRAHLRVVGEQLDVATVFIREWRYLEGERRERSWGSGGATRRAGGADPRGRRARELRSDLDEGGTALLALSAANWAYTWLLRLRHGRPRRPLRGAARRRRARLRLPDDRVDRAPLPGVGSARYGRTSKEGAPNVC